MDSSTKGAVTIIGKAINASRVVSAVKMGVAVSFVLSLIVYSFPVESWVTSIAGGVITKFQAIGAR